MYKSVNFNSKSDFSQTLSCLVRTAKYLRGRKLLSVSLIGPNNNNKKIYLNGLNTFHKSFKTLEPERISEIS